MPPHPSPVAAPFETAPYRVVRRYANGRRGEVLHANLASEGRAQTFAAVRGRCRVERYLFTEQRWITVSET